MQGNIGVLYPSPLKVDGFNLSILPSAATVTKCTCQEFLGGDGIQI